jgi:hypothetical protein
MELRYSDIVVISHARGRGWPSHTCAQAHLPIREAAMAVHQGRELQPRMAILHIGERPTSSEMQPPGPIARLIAASVSRASGSVVEQLLAMRERIVGCNESRGVRTALLHTAGWLFQWHEGPAEAVEQRWAASKSNRIHSHVRVLHRSVGPTLLEERVQVAAYAGPGKPTDVARRVIAIQNARPSAPVSPLEIWRRFSAPWQGRLPGGLTTDHDGRSVLLVIAAYSDSREPQAFHLGEKVATPVRGTGQPLANPLRNAYFGETHLHTSYSLDANLFGTKNDPRMAYHFAKGETVKIPEAGVKQHVVAPLDFAAVTDRAADLGLYSTDYSR